MLGLIECRLKEELDTFSKTTGVLYDRCELSLAFVGVSRTVYDQQLAGKIKV